MGDEKYCDVSFESDEEVETDYLFFESDTDEYTKSCVCCKRIQSFSQFIDCRTKKQCATCANCRMIYKQSRMNPNTKKFKLNAHYQKLKESLPPCRMCGDNETFHKEFNHIDPKGEINPEMKKIKIVAHCKTIELMDKEASKCECLCRKCHRKFTQSLLEKNKERIRPKETVNNKKARKKILKLRERVNNIKRQIGKCQDINCNDIFDSENMSFYEFDHIEREYKTNSICRMIDGAFLFEMIKKEIDKCQLLCGYCHLTKTINEHNQSFKETVTDRVMKFDKNTFTKLTQKQVDEIRKIWSTDFSVQQKDLEKQFNIHRSEISGIVRNKNWISKDYIPIKNRPKMKLSGRKLSDSDIIKIIEMYKKGNCTYKEISKLFNCSKSYIGQICRKGGR